MTKVCGIECGTFVDGSTACCVGPRGHRVDGSGVGRWHSPLHSDFLPTPAADREALALVIHSVWCPLLPPDQPCDTDQRAADALIATGLVAVPRDIETPPKETT